VLEGRDYFENFGDHANEMETSIMMKIAPQFVLPLSEAGSGKSRAFRLSALREGWAWSQRQWSKTSDDTGIGDPRKASTEKGERFLKDLTVKIADFFYELAMLDLDDLYE
jgi:creatinine amidohydrolase